MTLRRVPLNRWVLFWTLALGGAAFDLATKAAVFHAVGPPGSPPVSIGGRLPYSSLLFAILSIGAAAAICWYLFVRGAAKDALLTVALALIMAGALGNCYDRLVYGRVRDFVHFHVDRINFDFAIFNFADNMLVAGAVILMLLALRPESPRVGAEPAAAEAGQPTS